MDPSRLSDEELIAAARRGGGEDCGQDCLDVLFRRHYARVARWCLRLCSDPQQAEDVAQEVFLRVQDRIGGFRVESRFTTWLYAVTRSVAVNRGVAEGRRSRRLLPFEATQAPEPEAPEPDAAELAERRQIADRLRQAMARDLEPLEAQVLYLHFAEGLTLPAITRLLGLTNRSGAKKYVVAGRRKLKRRFGRWLARQSAQEEGS